MDIFDFIIAFRGSILFVIGALLGVLVGWIAHAKSHTQTQEYILVERE